VKGGKTRINIIVECVYRSAVYCIVHDVHPALEGGHLKEGQVGQPHIVEGYPGRKEKSVLCLKI
jgi:hypothetical protein